MDKKIKDFFVKNGKVLYISCKKFFKNDHTLQATALTYYTLFAVVPILALLFGIAKGFSLDDKLKSLIAERFAEQQNIVEWMCKFADTTLKNADGGIIAGIGILVLFWTVIRLATYVENSFNQIWAVRKGRAFFRKISDYLSIIIIAPIMLVVMSSSTIFARKLLTGISENAPDTFVQNSIETGLNLLPFVMAWLLFIFIYMFIPNTKVRLKSAFFASFFAAVLYQAAQIAYINIQVKLSSYNSIYGSFSALPLFLIWMQWSWMITLLGAEIAFVHQNYHTGQFEKNQGEFSHNLQCKFILALCKIVIDRFEAGNGYYTESELAQKINLPLIVVRTMLAQAVDCGLLQRVDIENCPEFVFAPGLPTDKFTVIKAVQMLENCGLNQLPNIRIEEFSAIEKQFEQFAVDLEKSSANRLLREI